MCLYWRAQHTLCIRLQGISLCHSASKNTISASQDSCKRQGWVGLVINAAQLPAPECAHFVKRIFRHEQDKALSSKVTGGDSHSPHPLIAPPGIICRCRSHAWCHRQVLHVFIYPISQHPKFSHNSVAVFNH